MKIAILGSAPSSIAKAPFGDTSWEIWACSPGAYPHLSRVNEFWEVHRWEPGLVGKPQTQKPWFTPEYVAWMRQQPVVWVTDPDALRDLPNARMLPWQELEGKYGSYCWTSSIAYMTAMAIDKIQANRAARSAAAADKAARLAVGVSITEAGAKALDEEPDLIAFYGVDMAANEELYSGQRAACQFFIQLLVGLKIAFYIPPESDLATPPAKYGVAETSHRAIKWLERRRELESRLAQAQGAERQYHDQALFIQGAIDDIDYMQKMWLNEGDSLGLDFGKVFANPATVAGLSAVETPSTTAKS